ncbi:shikimate dehydrogenase [Streptomyces sp. NBC_00234]|uniref:shikimate dehydrogenase n=1 Tax=Streptomyces sp. NBC_00234 TaxID=2903638 RepID=UPI002E2D4D90|nr:shikimate dehydrogenase [Streptomyces sp. NBC_00234]
MNTPRRAAVLGSPIAHSLSPALHRAAYAALGLKHWSYDRFEMEEAGLPGFIEGLDSSWAGLSVTMPLKRAIIPLLDEISETASSVNAVNTVVFAEDGRRVGDNTDIPGMVAALRERGPEVVESAVILGAGATASSALAALARVCIGPVTVYVRSKTRAREMNCWGESLGIDVRTADWSEAASGLGAPLVISTTPAGAADFLAEAVPENPGALFDVLYEPWPSVLAHAWVARKGSVIGGLELLVHQAALQFRLMTGCETSPLEVMRAAGESALAASRED